MKHLHCDQHTIEQYLNGELNDKQCAALERHALQCSECSEKLESGLSDVQSAFRFTFAPEDVPVSVRERIFAERPPALNRRVRWGWALGGGFSLAAAAIFALFIFGLRTPTAVVLEGTVVANGREYSIGDSLPLSGKLITMDRSRLRYGNAEFEINDPWVETDLTILNRTPRLRPRGSSIIAVDRGPAPPYALIAGNQPVVAFGTRFRVSNSDPNRPQVEVYLDAVGIGDSAEDVLHEGRTQNVENGTRGFIEDDPTAIEPGQLVLVPTDHGLVQMPYVPKNERSLPEISLRKLSDLARKLSSGGATATEYLLVAEELIRSGEARTAVQAALEALALVDSLVEAPADMRAEVALGIMHVSPQTAVSLLPKDDPKWNEWRAFAEELALLEAAGADSKEAPRQRAIRIGAILSRSVRSHSEKLSLGSCLLLLGDMSPAHDGALTAAAGLLRECSKSNAFTKRQIAVAYQKLGEALFNLSSRPGENLLATRKAYELWPRPDWAVNLASRLCEDGDPIVLHELRSTHFREVYTLVETALTSAPSYYTYERTLSLMRIIGDSQRDYDDVRSLLDWVVKTYSSVSEAKILAAGDLMSFGDDEAAYRMMAAALTERGNDVSSLGDYRVNWAILLHKKGKDEEALQALERSMDDTKAGNHVSKYIDTSWSYFEAIGDSSTALEYHFPPSSFPAQSSEVAAWQFDHSRLLAAAGRDQEAILMCKAFTANPESMTRPMDVAKSYLLLAQLLQDSNQQESRKFANLAKVLVETVPFKSGWMGLQNERLFLKAQALYWLGDRDRAVDLLNSFIQSWPPLAERRIAIQRLNSWLPAP